MYSNGNGQGLAKLTTIVIWARAGGRLMNDTFIIINLEDFFFIVYCCCKFSFIPSPLIWKRQIAVAATVCFITGED